MSLGLKYKNNEQIFVERQRGGVPYLSYPLFENTGIVNHGFSTRLGGVSTGCFSSMNISLTRGDDPEAVKKNRELIAQAIGVEVADFTYTQQTHTTNVKRVYARERGQSFPETDGMITDVPGICLVTSYADCVPLYFVDPVKKVIGLSHSGWRGTVGKIGKVTVEKMEENKQDFHKSRFLTWVLAKIPSICKLLWKGFRFYPHRVDLALRRASCCLHPCSYFLRFDDSIFYPC